MSSMNQQFSNEPIDKYLTTSLYGGLFVFFVLSLFRNTGIYPVVFADEWAYSSYSRLLPLRDAGVPSYFYLIFYRLTNLCGDAFLECARILNVFFFIVAGQFIFLTAKYFTTPFVAVLIALMSIGSAISSYSIYFMPESMFFAGFWLLTWCVFAAERLGAFWQTVVVGCCLGFLSLIKVHALFLLPGIAMFVLVSHLLKSGSKEVLKAVTHCFLLFIIALAVKLAISTALVGRNGMTILGSLYSSQSGTILSRDFGLFFQTFSQNLAGHLLALIMIFSLPCLLCVTTTLQRRYKENNLADIHGLRIKTLVLYSFLVIFPLVLLSAFFTASMAGNGPYETASRLHVRYYNFAFPLLLIVAGSYLTCLKRKVFGYNGIASSAIAVAAVTLTVLLASFLIKSYFTPSFVDSPELYGVVNNPFFFTGFLITSVILVFLFPLKPLVATQLYLFGFLPLMLFGGNWEVSNEVRKRLKPDAYDQAGIFARDYFNKVKSGIAITGASPAGVLRSMFHIDKLNVTYVQPSELDAFIASSSVTDIRWLLYIGEPQVPRSLGSLMQLNDFGLLTFAHKGQTLDFRQARWPGVISRSEGLSFPEQWGTWSIGTVVKFEFIAPLPKKFTLTLNARAFGPSTKEPVEIIIGHEARYVLLTDEFEAYNLDFTNDGNERTITFNVPNPTAPKSIGVGDDIRTLGIGLRELKIVPKD